MASSTTRERKRKGRSPPTGATEIEMGPIPTSATAMATVQVEEEEESEISPLVHIIRNKRRKDWAKLVAPVDEDSIKKYKPSISERFGKLFSSIPTPCRWLLNIIEHRKGYTIRSYFQYIIWLFYLNLFTFLICFTVIVMPTLIYPQQSDFYSYAISEYNRTTVVPAGYCGLSDDQCTVLNTGTSNRSVSVCLDNSLTASACCSVNTFQYYQNLSDASRQDSTKFFSDLIDGTGVLSVNRLFLGYYQNLTNMNHNQAHFRNYNMGLAVFLANLACLLISGILIVRKYGDGMEKSYVQNESFENNLFQYIFARWDHRTTARSVQIRQTQRFRSEIRNILFELDEKKSFISHEAREKILLKLKRIGIWLLTLFIFAGAITAVYFTNQYSFQERSKREEREAAGEQESEEIQTRFVILAVEYLPSITVSMINLLSQLIFGFMKNFTLYTSTTNVRHYLLRVILMRLVLLFAFMFIIILQITCNSNQCGLQSALTDCANVQGASTFIHCWETLLGQVVYRLVLTDTFVMLIIHLIVDPLRCLFICCNSSSKTATNDDENLENPTDANAACFLCQPLEFEIVDYVIDLTYSQTLCWHGLLFCPFLPLIAALKNVIIFLVKLLSVALFRQRSKLELSPARARYIFTSVLLFSFVWALLPIIFFVTVLKPSRGCGPFRLYSHDSNYYFYYPVRNLITSISAEAVRDMIMTLTSGIVIVPVVLILILITCILAIRRNSYRGASLELYKLLATSQKTHRFVVKNTQTMGTAF